ncbi:hypothetical protein [Desulfonatronospira sp.]|uniref:hypothetical protein n=1 Tax=Desulfonatronospira sp. TaxID=1962951 RepID=UPI0025C55BF6|nr:hypothetical protein [Desulfonatronospira sp.]
MIHPLSLPVVAAQSHIAQHFQVAAHNSPERYQAVLSDIAVSKFNQEKGMVPPTDKITQINPQKEHQSRKHLGPDKSFTRKKSSDEQENPIPLSENIVDLKV